MALRMYGIDTEVVRNVRVYNISWNLIFNFQPLLHWEIYIVEDSQA